jgi:nucleoside-diphosphate-sugar epimerase
MKIFLAGATGAIGAQLVPLLLHAGHRVAGTTRSAGKVDALRISGVEPIVVNVFDAHALAQAVSAVKPDVVIHQLTDLPRGLDPTKMVEGTQRNARMRSEGTQNLVSAALASGVPRLIAQSIAWMYAPGPEPHSEADPLDMQAIEGVVLRYGHLYGPNTGMDTVPEVPSLHVDAAALAALLAIEKAHSGIYNIAEQCSYLSIEKAQRELGFDPDFRLNLAPADLV